jgi:quinol monooxygenase YgiN
MEFPRVRLTVCWTVPPGEVRSIAAALQTLMMQTRSERGCVACSVSTKLGAQPRIDYVEEWASEPELQRHIKSDGFSSLAELMEHGTDRPVVTFDLPGKTRSLDYAEEVRQSSDRPRGR